MTEDNDNGHLDHIRIQCEIYHDKKLNLDQCLPILHINARSIKNKLDNIQMFIDNSGVDWACICISETWLKEEIIEYYKLDHYNLFASCRSNGEGGGAAIYVHEKYETTEILDLSSSLLESVFVEIKIKSSHGNKTLLIGEIYRPPSFPNTCFLDYLESVLDRIDREKRICLLAGDFNYNLLDVDNKNVLSFVNLMNSYGCFPTISLPTRVQHESSSLLDNIFINDLTLVKTCGVVIDDLSDHFPIFLSLHLVQNQIEDKPHITVFDKRKVTELNDFLLERLKNFQRNTDANVACSELIKAYGDGIQQYSKTVKYRRRKTPIKPWITPSILCCINRKTKLYKVFVSKRSLHAENEYKKYRNILTNVMRDAKRLYYQSLFQDNKDNGKKTWDLLNEIVNKKRNKHAKLPTMFFDNYGFSYENSHIAEGFNNFFAEVGTNLEKEIPVSCSGAVDYLGNPNYAPLNEELSTAPYEIAKIIKSLNPVGGGIDKISTKIILYTYEKCLPHLTFFFDLCLRTAVFPDHLKIALVVPIYKTGEKDKFNNYRPISLLPVFSKILEKLLHSRLLEYIEFNKILHPFQFGFRRKHSTYMPIAHLINEITESLQDQKIICGIYLDLKKSVPHCVI